VIDSREDRAAPLLSVIVAAYNSESTVGDMIDSVVAQTCPEWELIIVDDGSTDATAGIVAAYAAADPRIRLIRQSNAGTAMARNAGASLASGRLWCFLDADDMLLPQYIESQNAFAIAHPGFDIHSCNAVYLLRDGTRRPVWTDQRHSEPFSLSVAEQFAESSILLMAMITPRVFELTGGFRALHSEDYDFWLRALILGAKHLHNPVVLAVYRRTEGSRTTSLVAEAQSFLRIQREALEMTQFPASGRAAALSAIEFSRARVKRRELEESLLGGDYRDARRRYWDARAAFPHKGKYVVGLALIGVSPRLYAHVKRRRMI